jgi:hypothetical protein
VQRQQTGEHFCALGMPWVSKYSEVGQVIEVQLLGGAHCKDPSEAARSARLRQTDEITLVELGE